MSMGERGPAGDHGQAGDTGATGARGVQGVRGEKGERYSSWLTRHVTTAYVLLMVGMIISVGFAVYASEKANDRITDAVEKFQDEAIATDQAFCELTNRTFSEINKNRSANRSAYSLLQPAPGADPATAARLIQFREQLLATIDGDLPRIDCSGIGNGTVDFSLQDAIRNHSVPSPPAPTIGTSTTTTTVP